MPVFFFFIINCSENIFAIELALSSCVVFLVLDGLVGSREALRIAPTNDPK